MVYKGEGLNSQSLGKNDKNKEIVTKKSSNNKSYGYREMTMYNEQKMYNQNFNAAERRSIWAPIQERTDSRDKVVRQPRKSYTISDPRDLGSVAIDGNKGKESIWTPIQERTDSWDKVGKLVNQPRRSRTLPNPRDLEAVTHYESYAYSNNWYSHDLSENFGKASFEDDSEHTKVIFSQDGRPPFHG